MANQQNHGTVRDVPRARDHPPRGCRQPHQHQGQAAPPRRRNRALWNNALVAGLVSAIVAGAISLLAVRFQDQDTTAQERSAAQVAAITQLETAATNFDQATLSLWESCDTHPENCSGPPTSYFATETIFDADRANVTDPAADNLAAEMENDANNAITLRAMTRSSFDLTEMVTAFQQLIARCGQLIQGR